MLLGLSFFYSLYVDKHGTPFASHQPDAKHALEFSKSKHFTLNACGVLYDSYDSDSDSDSDSELSKDVYEQSMLSFEFWHLLECIYRWLVIYVSYLFND